MRGSAVRLAFALSTAAAVAAAPAGAAPPPRGGGTAALAPKRDPDPWFGRDKALHFGATAVIAGGGYGLAALATDDVPGRIAVGAAFGVGAGLAKEVADALGLGNPSWRDFAWDLLGAAVGLGVSVTVDLAISPEHF